MSQNNSITVNHLEKVNTAYHHDNQQITTTIIRMVDEMGEKSFNMKDPTPCPINCNKNVFCLLLLF